AGGLLKISFLAYALRWLLLSLISTPLWALLTQLLHGLSFAAFLVGGVTYIYELAPEGLNTTAQSIFNSVSFGLASIAGSLLGGYFYDSLGMPPMFRFISLIAIIAFFVFYLSDKSRAKATGERRA
ncbi:MAG TPA: MFS transporter, partial [Anaerolineales bacterium]